MAKRSKAPKIETPRWHVVIEYAMGVLIVTDIEELSELHDLVEGAHDWTFLDKITITHNEAVS